jgi:cadmium resistance protein CadD (predicted permease)
MIENIITSVLAFGSTNIDDIFILTLFYGSRKFKSLQIVLGQYLGIGTLVLISLVGSYIGSFFDERYIGFLGLFPIYLAIRHIVELIRKDKNEDDKEIEQVKISSSGIVAIAGVTIANGGDNIGVYVPLLTTMSFVEKTELIVIFVVMTYVWCRSAKYLASHPLIAKQLDKYGHVIMPIVLLALGVFIIRESNSLSLFM